MNAEFIEALSAICKEKGVSEDTIIDALEAALVAAYKKNFNSSQNVRVEINRKEGGIKVYAQKTVCEEVLNDAEEISLEDAKKLDKNAELEGIVEIEVTPRDFGRISAMTAKQVVTQRIREAERGAIYSEYTEKVNDIITGRVTRIEHGNVYVDIGKTEAYLPINEQPVGEVYEVDDTMKFYISEVRNGLRGTSIVLSRTHPGLVRRLFEREVPECQDGLVEVKGVAREAGSRTKIAVASSDKDVDASGSCIGPKGTRVQNVSDELNGEKIDIVNWSEDPVEFITASLSPAKVTNIEIDEENKIAKATVPEFQLSLAIGKSGQNVRLAARLTGWKIDISAQ